VDQPTREEILALAEAVKELSAEVAELRRDLRPPGPSPSPEEVDAVLARAGRAASLRREEARLRGGSPAPVTRGPESGGG